MKVSITDGRTEWHGIRITDGVARTVTTRSDFRKLTVELVAGEGTVPAAVQSIGRSPSHPGAIWISPTRLEVEWHRWRLHAPWEVRGELHGMKIRQDGQVGKAAKMAHKIRVTGPLHYGAEDIVTPDWVAAILAFYDPAAEWPQEILKGVA